MRPRGEVASAGIRVEEGVRAWLHPSQTWDGSAGSDDDPAEVRLSLPNRLRAPWNLICGAHIR